MSDGEYAVTVEVNGEPVLIWMGYAENPSDALSKAQDKRDEEFAKEQREAQDG